ncbi:MAG TPA: DUF6081 family protein [Gaiellaceae bacterium]|nr:DUF6081 family protein [Gaiellaceae bacterium]
MRFGLLLAAVLAAVAVTVAVVGGAGAASPKTTKVVYDDFSATGGYTLSNYNAKWSNGFGLGDMGDFCADGSPAHGDTRTFTTGAFAIADAPFTCGADFSVFDHLKYIATSNVSFSVPTNGSLTFSVDIAAQTPGTELGHVVHGTYGPPGSYPSGAPYAATVLEGQQAGAVLNMISLQTGQLFDWFVSGSRAFTLIERLPSSVLGGSTDPSSPGFVGPEKMYTQIVDEFAIKPNVTHNVAITYTRGTGNGASTVEYFIDGKRVSKVNNVGIPVDKQPGQKYTGIYPSFGPGEDLKSSLNSFVIGHGTFSLLDAFPFQWGWSFNPGPTCEPAYPDVCAASVSIPLSERLFGQGVNATFDNFTVTTVTK